MKKPKYNLEQLSWLMKAAQAKIAIQNARRQEDIADKRVREIVRGIEKLPSKNEKRAIFGPAIKLLRKNRICTREINTYLRDALQYEGRMSYHQR